MMSQGYQSTTIWLYSAKNCVIIALCAGFLFFGVPAPMLWCLVMGLVLPVGVSLRLHLLQQNNRVILPKQNSQWIIYVHGIPVRETHSDLQNPFFPQPALLRRFFLCAWSLKGALQLVLIGAFLHQLLRQLPDNSLVALLTAAAGVLTLGYMLWRLWQTAQALQAAWSGNWRMEQGDFNGVACFRALVAQKAGTDNQQWQPALARFLQL
ncbi:hypothetical protein FJU30_16765 [Affinibrenneria salicis]|uniref:Uncharacterized protein n=1 Tax=Affinibrenneria salicis TaxID=2590031 RepID=A0A5J5FWY4_9GAMM|nr:hypothetical protein [Affinibrenneria salicis]KAA8998071.1 hypothetical protein FJU30_16765 [Affinibrenneria salicis]